MGGSPAGEKDGGVSGVDWGLLRLLFMRLLSRESSDLVGVNKVPSFVRGFFVDTWTGGGETESGLG